MGYINQEDLDRIQEEKARRLAVLEKTFDLRPSVAETVYDMIQVIQQEYNVGRHDAQRDIVKFIKKATWFNGESDEIE